MNGAKVLLECLKRENIDTLFGYPGGAVIPLYDALYDYKEDFKHIRTAHEQGLVHAADGYARSTGKVGVCITTSGPGATNAITGIATAYMDSTPMVVITGQVPTSLLGKDSFQEIDITGATLSMTKHSYLIRKVEQIPTVLKEAFKVCNTGRKGPVLIDIPKDLFIEELDFDPNEYIPYNRDDVETNYNYDTNEAVKLINSSTKPVIYAGGGVKSCDGYKLLEEFAVKIDTPVVNTLMGLGSIDRDHKLSLGMVGMHGSKKSNLTLNNCDLVIAIGARFSDRVIGKSSEFAKNAKVIHIDIDPSEISKNINVDVCINGNLRDVLKSLLYKVDAKSNDVWKEEIENYYLEENVNDEEFHPKNIIKIVNEDLGKDCVAVTDVGQHQMWTAKYWNFTEGRTLITSAGLGTMGFGLGAAIGAKLGNSKKNVILLTGDGSFRMNCNELATISQYNIPIVIVLLNNQSLGMVRQWQKLFSKERYSETDIECNVDYIALGRAYNIDGFRVDSLGQLKEALSNYRGDRAIIIQCDIKKDYDVYPIIPPNETLDNLIYN